MVVSLKEHRRVVFANERASQLIQEGDPFLLSGDALRLSRPSEEARLAEIFSEMEKGARPPAKPASRTLPVICETLRRSYLLTAKLLESRRSAHAMAILFIEELSRSGKADLGSLRATWNFTRAEGALAVALIQGGSLKDAARACGITEGTARQYLKRIFMKVNVRGQVELLARLLTTST